MDEIVFEMVDGFDLGFTELTGITHPKTTDKKKLTKCAKAAMQVDKNILGFRLVGEGERKYM